MFLLINVKLSEKFGKCILTVEIFLIQHAFSVMDINDEFDAEPVIIREGDDELEPGFIMKYHPRGECELISGLVWLESGRYVNLSNTSSRTKDSLIPIKKTSDIPNTESFKTIRAYMKHRGRVNPEKKKTRTGVVKIHKDVRPELFRQKEPFLGFLEIDKPFRTLHAVIAAVESNEFIMKRRKNDEVRETNLRKLLKGSQKGRNEGIWMNPAVSIACLKYFGIPRTYLGSGLKLVSNYNQLIFQVDGTDSARTLGMHKDRDDADKPVNTILGCVAGDGGKDVILWKNLTSAEAMPRWWRNEGMSRDSFLLAKIQCKLIPSVHEHTEVLTLNPGEFIYMPKNTYHWVCPSDAATWTVMVTSSFY